MLCILLFGCEYTRCDNGFVVSFFHSFLVCVGHPPVVCIKIKTFIILFEWYGELRIMAKDWILASQQKYGWIAKRLIYSFFFCFSYCMRKIRSEIKWSNTHNSYIISNAWEKNFWPLDISLWRFFIFNHDSLNCFIMDKNVYKFFFFFFRKQFIKWSMGKTSMSEIPINRILNCVLKGITNNPEKNLHQIQFLLWAVFFLLSSSLFRVAFFFTWFVRFIFSVSVLNLSKSA